MQKILQNMIPEYNAENVENIIREHNAESIREYDTRI